MELLTLYCGQGELAVVRHAGEAIIIDSRCLSESADDIERQLATFTKGQNVVGLVLTGFDADHADPVGVENVLSDFEPSWIMYPKVYKDTENASEVFRIIAKHEKRRRGTAHPLQRVSVRVDKLDQNKLDGLTTNFELKLYSPHTEDMDCSNNCSIVLKMTGLGPGGFAFLTTGDTENDRWDTITRLFGERLKSDVLSAPHHGSKTAAHARMAQLVDPNTVLISAGVDNQYGHPHPQAVKLYSAVAEHVFATNVEGGVSLLTRPRGDDFDTRLVK